MSGGDNLFATFPEFSSIGPQARSVMLMSLDGETPQKATAHMVDSDQKQVLLKQDISSIAVSKLVESETHQQYDAILGQEEAWTALYASVEESNNDVDNHPGISDEDDRHVTELDGSES